jgi:hypothetical protein
MRNVFARGAVAGAASGLLTSVAAYFWLEPVLSRAIELEGPAEAGPVSRQTQQLLGMPVGFVLIGLALGMLFAATYRVLSPAGSAWQRSIGLATGGFLALALIPQLRYPASPPGVGDAETVGVRTSSFLLAIALGVVVTSGAYAGLRALRARGVGAARRQTAVAAGAVVTVAVGYLLLPDSGDAVDAPAQLVYDFRVRSLGLLALLYALLGASFGALTLRTQQSDAADQRASQLR